MASIETRVTKNGEDRYYVRYRTPTGEQRSKSFRLKRDARNFLTTVENSKLAGSFIDAKRQKVSVGDWADQWLSGKANLGPKTRETYEFIIEKHIRPRWGTVTLDKVNHVEIQEWISGIERAPATVHKVYQVFNQILRLAVRDQRLAVNPCTDIDLPKVVNPPKKYLTHRQVQQLADSCGKPHDLIVLFLAYTGLRFGEMAALRVGRIDFARRRALISESASPVRGAMHIGPTKGGTHREVPLPVSLVPRLVEVTADKLPEAFLFTGAQGAVLRSRQFQRDVFSRAAAEVGLPGLTPHELRHTAASLAIQAGADVKVVQTMLGHKKATMTLDLYGHLFSDQLDVVADAMEAARVGSLG